MTRLVLVFFVAVLLLAQKASFPNPNYTALDNTGAICVGCKLYTYAAGGTTPLATYTTASGGVSNANPVIMDSAGRANVWTTPGSSYRFDLYTAANVLIWTVDNIPGGTLAGSSTVSANTVFAGPTTGSAAVPAFRSLVSADIPNNAANTSGLAATATALASNPTDCGSGPPQQYAYAIAASGNLTCQADNPTFYEYFDLGPLVVNVGVSASYVPTWNTASTPTSNFPAATSRAGSNTNFAVALFSTTSQTLQVRTYLPADWVTGGQNIELWFANVTDHNTGHNEIWSVQTACASQGDTVDPSFNTAQTATVAVRNSAGALNVATLSTFTVTGCAAGDLMWLKVGLDASRTATGNADLQTIRTRLKVTKTVL
jgi:hypothetical protein